MQKCAARRYLWQTRIKMVKPVSVKALSKYKIRVEFQDGTSGEVDLSDCAGKGIFRVWDDADNFEKVYINEETSGIAWNDELEICPETIYEQIKSKSNILEETV